MFHEKSITSWMGSNRDLQYLLDLTPLNGTDESVNTVLCVLSDKYLLWNKKQFIRKTFPNYVNAKYSLKNRKRYEKNGKEKET